MGVQLTHLLERDNTIHAGQVGFRRGRSAEENLGRLIQEVQDGGTGRAREDARQMAGQCQIRADGA